MEYKRLTVEKGFACCFCKDRKCIRPRIFCGNRYKCEVYNRLAELEDKIEQGTLIDTEKYFIDEGAKYGSGFPYLICKCFVEAAIHDFCGTIEEAEKRLKELQNG